MNATLIALACCLVAQVPKQDFEPKFEKRRASPAAKIDSPDARGPVARRQREADTRSGGREPPDEGTFQVPLTPTDPTENDNQPSQTPASHASGQKLRPPQLLAEALLKSQEGEGAVVGRPTTLVSALSHSNDRQQQIKIAKAYWRLSTAQAGYHWARDARDQFARYTHQHVAKPETLSARAAARAAVMDAELAVAQAQQELGELIGAKTEEDLPLATDRPHVGGYTTDYENVFRGRAPPPRIRLINRTLPIRRKAIDYHGEAIVAAHDALESAGEEFAAQQSVLAVLQLALAQLQEQRTAFLTSVRDYNQDGAEYMLTVVAPGASPQVLASRLILKSERGTAPEPSSTRPSEEEGENPPERSDSSRDSLDYRSQYQPEDPDPTAEERGIYHALLHVKPPANVQKLGSVLHWDRDLPDDVGQPWTLADCLRSAPATNRLAIISAYWRARERVARYQATHGQTELLNGLSVMAIGHRDRSRVPEAGVRLQAARFAAQADLAEAHVALLNAEFELTQLLGRRLDEPWVMPATAPQAGGYNVGDQAARRAWQRAELVRLQHKRLQEHADTVIRTDFLRARLINEAKAPQGALEVEPGAEHWAPLDPIILATTRQHAETLAFLRDLTGYNIAIAQYVLAVMPANVSNDELVKMLVISRT